MTSDMRDGYPTVRFHRSSFCGGGSCVEVAALGNEIALRDSKQEDSPVLRFTADEWEAFIAGVIGGEFNQEALQR